MRTKQVTKLLKIFDICKFFGEKISPFCIFFIMLCISANYCLQRCAVVKEKSGKKIAPSVCH